MLYDRRAPLGGRDTVTVSYGFTAGIDDLRNDMVGGPFVGAFAVYGSAYVVDQHPGTSSGEKQGVLAPESSTGAGDYRNFSVETYLRHRPIG